LLQRPTTTQLGFVAETIPPTCNKLISPAFSILECLMHSLKLDTLKMQALHFVKSIDLCYLQNSSQQHDPSTRASFTQLAWTIVAPHGQRQAESAERMLCRMAFATESTRG